MQIKTPKSYNIQLYKRYIKSLEGMPIYTALLGRPASPPSFSHSSSSAIYAVDGHDDAFFGMGPSASCKIVLLSRSFILEEERKLSTRHARKEDDSGLLLFNRSSTAWVITRLFKRLHNAGILGYFRMLRFLKMTVSSEKTDRNRITNYPTFHIHKKFYRV